METIKLLLIYSGIVVSTIIAIVVTEALYKTIIGILGDDKQD